MSNLTSVAAVALTNVDNNKFGASDFDDVIINWKDGSEPEAVTISIVNEDLNDTFKVDALKLGLTGTDNDLETVTLDVTGGKGVTNGVTITTLAVDTVDEVKVTGSLDLAIGALSASVKEVDASTFTGDLTATLAFAANGGKLIGGSGDDQLNGTANNDTITGGAGNDTINGGLGADVLSGGAGDDVIRGGQGIDQIDLGTGTDVLDLVTGLGLANYSDANRDIVKGFDAGVGGDIVRISNAGGVAGIAIQETSTTGAALAFNTIANDILEITADLSGVNMLDDAALLTAISGGGNNLTVSNVANDDGYLLAYADGKAYLYYIDAGVNAIVNAGEIHTLAIFENVAVGAFDVSNFSF